MYGRDITKNLIELDVSTQDMHITGFIGKPAICRGNRGFENYYINGRYIKSHIITRAIEEAYRGFIMPHNYPFTAAAFSDNPSILDVNVHPTKMELRFSKNEFVYQFVLDAITDALNRRELIPEVKPSDTVTESAMQNTTTQQNASAQPEPPIPSMSVQKPSRLPESFEAERLPASGRKITFRHRVRKRYSIRHTQHTKQTKHTKYTQYTKCAGLTGYTTNSKTGRADESV